MADWYGIFITGLIGVAVGSFINVCADRLPAGQSLVSPPSHCPACQTQLRAADLIPMFSYLALRGRCRYCSAHIPFRLFLVELAAGVMFGAAWAAYGPTYQGYAMLAYVGLFLTIFLIDLEHQIIPNKIVLPGVLAALAIASFWPEIGPARAAIGAGVGFGAMLALYLIPGAVIGEGDVKLAAVIGAAVGFPVVLPALAMAFVLGGATAIALLLIKARGRKQLIPFGPFMAVAALVSLAWGPTILDWYLRTFWLA